MRKSSSTAPRTSFMPESPDWTPPGGTCRSPVPSGLTELLRHPCRLGTTLPALQRPALCALHPGTCLGHSCAPSGVSRKAWAGRLPGRHPAAGRARGDRSAPPPVTWQLTRAEEEADTQGQGRPVYTSTLVVCPLTAGLASGASHHQPASPQTDPAPGATCTSQSAGPQGTGEQLRP